MTTFYVVVALWILSGIIGSLLVARNWGVVTLLDLFVFIFSTILLGPAFLMIGLIVTITDDKDVIIWKAKKRLRAKH